MQHRIRRRVFENWAKFHIGGNLPIFGKALIVAAAAFARTAHDLAMTAPANLMPCNMGNDVTIAQGVEWILAGKARS
jgi:hypothetical protein